MIDFVGLDEKYQEFKKLARDYDFFPRGFRETLMNVRGFRLVRPASRRYQEPGEICFEYLPPRWQREKGNDYKVVICTTKRGEGFVGKDSGWVLIVDGKDEIVYSKGPFIRTSLDFFDTLLGEGRVARWRVFYRPLHCERYMLLVHGQALKSQFWRCEIHFYEREHNQRFDDLRKPLPPETMQERLDGRAARRKQREKIRAEGKDPSYAFRLRMKHPWEKQLVPSSDISF